MLGVRTVQPFLVLGSKIYGAVKFFGPIQVRAVEMRMRNGNCFETTMRLDKLDGPFIQ